MQKALSGVMNLLQRCRQDILCLKKNCFLLKEFNESISQFQMDGGDYFVSEEKNSMDKNTG